MEKVNIMKMETLNMKVISRTVNMMEMEKNTLKMVGIILENLKVDILMVKV